MRPLDVPPPGEAPVPGHRRARYFSVTGISALHGGAAAHWVRLRECDVGVAGHRVGRSQPVHERRVDGLPRHGRLAFLLRIAADRTAHPRVGALRLAAVVARRSFWDDGSRAGLLSVADPDDSRHFDMGGYLRNWTVEAARDAIAADAHIPIALLHDPDPEIREAATYALAAASGRAREISTALHQRLGVEEDARVRAGLVLAIAQLAHEHDPGDTVAFARALWSDPTGPAEVRVGAALGWLCLVDDAVPDALRAVIEESVTPELHRLLSPSPWMRQVEDTGVDGLSHTLGQMLDPDSWSGPAPEPCF
ncbi:hypothetical protein [Embleya sp. NPDC001921]